VIFNARYLLDNLIKPDFKKDLMASPYFLLSLPIFGLFVGAVIFRKGFGKLKMKRFIEDTPTSKIRSLAMGFVEVYGKVTPIASGILKSPFGNIECIYFRYIVEESMGGEEIFVETNCRGRGIQTFYTRGRNRKSACRTTWSKISPNNDVRKILHKNLHRG
jgi:hypothetical protein